MSIQDGDLNAAQLSVLRDLAKRYVWWKSPDEAVRYPQRVIAQVMNLGDYDDVLRLSRVFDDGALRDVIRQAEIGQFNARSWTYWHYRLDLAELDQVPPLPARRFAERYPG